MAVNTISGKFLVGTISGAFITGTQGWTVRETTDQLDGTTGSDLGFENDDYGIIRAEIELEIVQNLAAGIYTQVAAGQRIADLKLYRAVVDAQPAFTFPIATIYESTNMGKVKDRFTVSVKARSNGPYTRTNPGAG